MPITEEQRAQRKMYLGSSDMAAILGVNPFRNAADVYLEKVSEMAEKKTIPAMALGNWLEDGVLNFAEAELNSPLIRNVFRQSDIGGCPLASHIDAIAERLAEPVEAKTTSKPDEWGDPGTDEVPDWVIVQCQVHMICMPAKQCHVPVLLPADGRLQVRMYCVQYSDSLAQTIIDAAIQFWNNHVVTRTPPPASAAPHIETFRHIKRVPEKSVEVDPHIIEQWLAAKEVAKNARSGEEEAKAVLLMALGDAEQGESEVGNVTYMEQTRKACEVKESTFRVLRYKKPKGVK